MGGLGSDTESTLQSTQKAEELSSTRKISSSSEFSFILWINL